MCVREGECVGERRGMEWRECVGNSVGERACEKQRESDSIYTHLNIADNVPCNAPCSSGPAAFTNRALRAGPYINAVRASNKKIK